jgi:hypothetical protein
VGGEGGAPRMIPLASSICLTSVRFTVFFCILLGASSCRIPRKRELGRIHYVGVSGCCC